MFLINKNIKFKIISEGLNNGVTLTCKKYNISRTLYYRWLKRYKVGGIDALDEIKKNFVPVNKTHSSIEVSLLNLIKQYPNLGPRYLKYTSDELGYDISESAIFNIMKRNNLTKKESRIKFSKKSTNKATTTIPPLDNLISGECWLFWITDCGIHNNLEHVYIYTFYDIKSRIACSRLYDDISLHNFEDILTSTAMPVAQTLNLKVNYLCLFNTDKIIKNSKNAFNSKINKIISDNGFDFNVHIFTDSNEIPTIINNLKMSYTEGCLSFLIPLINTDLSIENIKIKFQHYLRDYNINYKSNFNDKKYTPVEYHNKTTDSKLILPMWAYITREY